MRTLRFCGSPRGPSVVRAVWACSLALLGAQGCSSDDAPTLEPAEVTREPVATAEPAAGPVATAEPVADGCDAVPLDAPEDGVQIEVEMDLKPGQERQVCKLVQVDRAVNLNWSLGRLSQGSHHGTTARTSYKNGFPSQNIRGETVADPTATIDCESVSSDWDAQGVIATGRAPNTPPGLNNKGMLPPDVAIKVAAGDILVMNFHMINATDKPIRSCYKQNIYSIPEEQVKIEAGTIFWYNPFITVPANSRASSTMACPISHDITLAGQVSHMHKRGDGFTATLLDRDPLEGAKDLQTLFEGTEWDEPVVQINSPALSLTTGQWIEWTCEYTNPENRNVSQGQWTTDEMCMFVGTYWPRSPEMDSCGGRSRASRFLGTGTKNAHELLECWNASQKNLGGGGPETNDERYATQRCITESCPRVSARFRELMMGEVDPNSVTCD